MPDPQASTRQAPREREAAVRDAVGRVLDAVQLLAQEHIELARGEEQILKGSPVAVMIGD